MSEENIPDVPVQVMNGTLSERDAVYDEIDDGFFSEVPLEQYLKSSRLKGTLQSGEYASTQGATITPLPCWAIEFQTGRRRVGGSYQVFPKRSEDMYTIATAERARDVTGPGQSKKQWRGTMLEGLCSPPNLFTIVTSTYLVPFSIGHRYTAHLPAIVQEKDIDAEVTVEHELANTADQSLSSWRDQSGQESKNRTAISDWTARAQKLWAERRNEDSPELVSERLDYYNFLSKQRPRQIRVVHTRSRKLYAAVLDPNATTSLGLSYNGALVHTRVDDSVIDTDRISSAGVVCDNKLHYINVESEYEAYWLSGLLNSDPFEDIVMEHASGDPPNIYSLPAKLLDEIGLEFNSENQYHIDLAELAVELESSMHETVRDYIQNEKNVDVDTIDDSDASPEIPSMVITAYVNRFNEDDKLDRLNKIAATILEE